MEGSAERGVTAGGKAKGTIVADACGGDTKINGRGFGGRQLRRAKTIIQVLSGFLFVALTGIEPVFRP